ncbi:MAG: hypothetical protein ACTHNB_02050 [Gaiellaceae bacterium]
MIADVSGNNENVTKRGPWIAAVACAALLATTASAAPGPAKQVPPSVATYLLGAKMIRGEIVIKRSVGEPDYRLDRGKLAKRYAAGSLTLLERDGTKTPITVASTAKVLVNGLPSTLRRLRLGMQIAVWHIAGQPANNVLAGRVAPKWPKSLAATLLGPQLVRAEIAVQDTALHDYWLDHGRIKQVGVSTLTLREPNGTDETIDISPTARVKLNGQNASFLQLHKGMTATTIHDGDKPADQVYATGR